MKTTIAPTGTLEPDGFSAATDARWNLVPAVLYEHAVRRGEGVVAEDGPLACFTGQFTGRSPKDKFVVREPSSEADVCWGRINRPIDDRHFDALHRRMLEYLDGREVFVQDCYAGADPEFRLPIRIITEHAWQSLFAHTMFINEPDEARLAVHDPAFTVIAAPGCDADPADHGTNSGTFILLHFGKRLVLIGGTSYAGEIKKSIFTVMNYLMPLRHVLPMHCSANVGPDEDVALFFGLSGTGKTTLSSDPERRLIGDDEHGWSEHGIFNFEGGCYAKTIRLSAEAEPQIFAATRRFGSVMENVTIDPCTRRLDLDDASVTENTRMAYPISFIEGSVATGQAGHPRHIVMLTADAFGVMPPISRLTPDGAMYHFLSGYTAQVAGTERGLTEPTATFSACFGAPFMVWHPTVYAKLLGERIAGHRATVWLINTGWTGGAYGEGFRIKIAHTRAMIRAALSGALDDAVYCTDPVFNLDVPSACPGVPTALLTPRGTWRDPAAFDRQAAKLAAMFSANFVTFVDQCGPGVAAAGPRG